MALWKHFKDNAVLKRLQDEAQHEEAMIEIHSGKTRDGLWVKALISAGGSVAPTKAEYLRLLVTALRDERYMAERMAEQGVPPRVKENPTQTKQEFKGNELTQSESELMARFGIHFDGEYYHYKSYRYTKFGDAVSYARLNRE